MILLNVSSDNYNFKINNCIFQNNNHRLLRIDAAIQKPTRTTPSIIINNCKFYNNMEGILRIGRYTYTTTDELFKTIIIELNNNTFINNRGLFLLKFSHLTINNCYFNTIERNSMNNEDIVFIRSVESQDNVTIINSIFEDIYVKDLFPLITVENMNFKVENTHFSNCKSSFGYLFYIRNKENLKLNNKDLTIWFKNTTFQNTSSLFHGDGNKYLIEKSIFKDYDVKKPFLAVSDSKNSKFSIIDTHFYNINLSNSLFIEDSSYYFTNVTLKNIKSNSKAIFYFYQRNVEINGMIVEDIQCAGDKSSFLVFDSGDTKRTISVNNLSIN
ncbi:hypothetical protein BCR36DRAFT_317697, partial [Piromyces finnis]